MNVVARQPRRAWLPAVLVGAWLLALAGFAIWTRRPMMREGLWTDEAISVYVATADSPSEFLLRNRTSDYTPPLFNVLLAGYVRVAGSEEMALKVFAMTIGLLALAAAAWLAGELGGPIAAALAAALLVNNPIMVDMSAELRAYSLSALLASASLLAVFRLRRRGDSAGLGAFVALAALLTLLVYSHIAGGIVVAVMLGWALFESRRPPTRRFGRRLAASCLAAGGTFLFWLPTTWRQARIGLPWEKKLTFSEARYATWRQTQECLPIPQAFSQPMFWIGIAILTVIGIGLRAPIRGWLRNRRELLSLPAFAVGAVWVVLGLYTRQSSRYLIISAVLTAVLFACVLAQVLAAAATAPPRIRLAAVAGIVAVALSAFAARASLYSGRLEVANRPKSGFRTLCRSGLVEPGTLAIVVPDYLAPTAWYYCGRDEKLRGFVRWERPFLFDPSRNRELWTNPAAARETVARVEETLRRENQSRFVVLEEETAAGLLPLFEKPVADLTTELEKTFEAQPPRRFHGRQDSERAVVWIRR